MAFSFSACWEKCYFRAAGLISRELKGRLILFTSVNSSGVYGKMEPNLPPHTHTHTYVFIIYKMCVWKIQEVQRNTKTPGHVHLRDVWNRGIFGQGMMRKVYFCLGVNFLSVRYPSGCEITFMAWMESEKVGESLLCWLLSNLYGNERLSVAFMWVERR